MRILLAPDLHCHQTNYGRMLPHGEHSRLVEWRVTAEAMLDAAVKAGVTHAVFPGDFFVTARPSPRQVLEVGALFRDFELMDIKVIGFPGNHDLPGIGQAGPCDLVAAMRERCWAINTPSVIEVDGISFAVLPSVKPATINAEATDPTDAAEKLSSALLDIARGLRAQCYEGLPKVLCGHWTIGGSITSSNQVLGGTEPQLPLGELLGMGWDAVLFGHIHKPQVLHRKPFVGYAGALQRCDFGEEKDPRGCWIIDLDAGTHEWIDLPARDFKTCEIYEDELPRIIEKPEEIAAFSGIEDAIVRVKYQATEEQAKQVDGGAIIKALQNAGAHHVAGIFPEIIKSERTRETGITESTSPLQALETWLKGQDMGAHLKGLVLSTAEELLEEVR
jgi:exonuclease SbcD